MAKNPNQKLKLLYLEKILRENTDDDHPMSVKDLIAELARYGVAAERKSVYADIRTLEDFGVNVIKVRNKTTGYFIGDRDFQLAELKLLVDVVQCSKFITEAKSREIIDKLARLTSRHNEKSLQRQVVLADRLKMHNEYILYSVDGIFKAIESDRQIRFKYFNYDAGGGREFRKDGAFYCASPYALVWDNENYYLVAYKAGHDDFTHYRVDRMTDLAVEDTRREKLPKGSHFNVSDYSKKVFSMFGGEEQLVELVFCKDYLNQFFDRFGKDSRIEKCDEEHCRVKAKVRVSPPFYAWIAQFGDKVRILSPEPVVAEYKARLNDILKLYI